MNGKKLTFLFPGQGSQYVGMAKDLFEEFSSINDLYGTASEILKYDLANVCFSGPEEKLKQTVFTQPAIFVHSCALQMVLAENFIKPSCAAGHSLGEYSALVASGAFTFETALSAIAKRSVAMQQDCDKTAGTMAAIIGLDFDKIAELIKGIDGIAVPANYNSPDQTVIAGEKSAVETACEILKGAGAKRALLLPVSGAYHSPLMKQSSDIMTEYIGALEFGNFQFPIYSNVGAEPVMAGDIYLDLLSRQILSPVLWYPILKNMYRDEVRHFVEIGPGKVLQGTVKRSLDDPEIIISGVDTLDDLDSFMNQFAGTDTE